MSDRSRPLTAAEKGRVYEQTLACEFGSWADAWLARHPGSGVVCERIGGAEGAPSVVVTAGPGGAHLGETLGLGLEGPCTDASLERVEAAFVRAGAARARVEISPFADPALPTRLTARGFGLDEFLHVFFRELASRPDDDDDGGVIRVEAVESGDHAALELAARTVAQGMSDTARDDDPPAEDLLIARQIVLCPRVASFVAWVDGERAGGACCGVWAGHPLAPSHLNLYSGSTRPAFRGRGVQAALIKRRLRFGFDAGARSASLDCSPHVATGGNARRAGFELLYTKAVLKKPL